MSTTVTIYPTSPTGSCPFAELPHELMTEVFLHLDPHTLYTSIRQLNRDWKETVESHIIPMAFTSGKWRLALRIHQRPRKAASGQENPFGGPPPAPADETDAQRAERVQSTLGALEDEMLPPSNEARTTTTYLPLELDKVNPAADRFEFSTGINWYAIYEIDANALQGDTSFRLDLDFGVAWRFDGDGKEDEEQRPGGWTKLDQENGWLSKFYCSNYDLGREQLVGSSKNNGSGSQQRQDSTETYRLHATQLTRRKRVPAGRPSRPGEPIPLQWDDSHLEYFHLQLSLGTEFFVRRSARANLLMRALEAEAARREAAATGTNGDRYDETTPTSPTPSTPNRLHRPLAQKAALAALSNRHASAGGGAPSATTPPPSRSSPPGQLHPDMSPAEQLQLMAKNKAAAKAAGKEQRASSARKLPAWARGAKARQVGANLLNPRTVSQPVSRNSSQPPSLAPSRAVSRAPTRPGSPTNDSPPDDVMEDLVDTTSRLNTSRFNTPAVPSTPLASPRDMPFFRAQALSLSTASPFTHRALSGYTTPNTATGTGSFALRGGGGAEPGGTPFAEFKARLRRAVGFAPAPDPVLAAKNRNRANSASSAMTLTPSTTLGAQTQQQGWIKTQDPKLDGHGVQREWKWSKVVAADEQRYAGQVLETEWSWSR